MTAPPAADRHPPDLRLVPAALATWAVTLLGLGFGSVAAALVAGLGAVVALVAGLRSRAPAAVAVGGCAAAAGLVIGAHTLLVAVHPLREQAQRGAAATLRVVLKDDPRTLPGTGYGSRPGGATQVLIPAVLHEAAAGADRWIGGGRVLLIAPVDGWAGLLPGQAVTASGLLAPPSRADLTVAVLRVRGPPDGIAPPSWWQVGAGGLRSGLRAAAAAALPPAEAGLLPGLAVGDTGGLTAESEDDFRAAGLTHLLAVSGANLAVVSGALLALLRWFRADPRLAAAVSAAAVVGFVVLARPSPSVVRAGVMGGIVLLAMASGRARSALPALAAAVLVLLPLDPALAQDPGFALSVVATGALVLVAPGLAAALRRRRVPGWIADALAVSTAAFAVTAPLVAGLSGQVAPVAVVANLLAAPAVAPATVLGVLAALVSAIAPPLAEALAWAAGPCVGWLVLVADRAAGVPRAALPWPSGAGGALLLAGLLVLLVLVGRNRRSRAVLLAVLLGLALVLVPTRLVPPGWPPAGWAAVACDVGQGDALVLATGRPGWVVLVDAGPDDGLVDACLRRLGVVGLALVVISHLHADHVGGLAGALRGRAVGGVAVGPVRVPQWALRDVARHAGGAGAPVVALATGHTLRWPALTLDVIGPARPPAFVDPDDGTQVNDGSVVLRATTPAGTVLLPGDAELAEQADLLGSGADLRADVLKMPHHGSRSTVPAFLDAVSPRAVVVSVGAGNRYGHPNAAMLGRLAAAGAAVRRTDEAGDVAVVEEPSGGGLLVVTRGDPLPAPRRRGGSSTRVRSDPRTVSRRRVRNRVRDNAKRCADRVRPRGPRAPPAPPCSWTARWPWGPPGPPPRRGS
jgi:competence protein ComEC